MNDSNCLLITVPLISYYFSTNILQKINLTNQFFEKIITISLIYIFTLLYIKYKCNIYDIKNSLKLMIPILIWLLLILILPLYFPKLVTISLVLDSIIGYIILGMIYKKLYDSYKCT